MAPPPSAAEQNAEQTRQAATPSEVFCVSGDCKSDPRGGWDAEIQGQLESQAVQAPANANNRTVSGHGAYYRSDGTFVIPANTYITIYVKAGQMMLVRNGSGELMEGFTVDAIGEGKASPEDVKKFGLVPITLGPGASMPDITVSEIGDSLVNPETKPFRVTGKDRMLRAIVYEIADKNKSTSKPININIGTCFTINDKRIE